ncbi:6,7-dimethyl-8-ribityllumazine synthase [Candidatus Viadribacter manganicus]|uniref:6,7-dimethyl-8-ribityllumazine synthase n=1 Tax=Candidatus Viadribacter manganicus TaxID=1759059 RepID=UPI001D17A686|nr:6,7-dimethyl-8-ribityllumazine synthase [Candidatus Viadribacter manganicus]
MKDVAEKSPATKLPGAKLLLVVSPYYRGVADMMQRGAEKAAAQAEVTLDRIFVPGAFEIPAAIAHAAKANVYDGFVALGCVVRGETSHYDYVCGESARALMDLATIDGLAIGYGILTVENLEQAEVRAEPARGDKGGEATKAALSMIAIKRRFAGAVK